MTRALALLGVAVAFADIHACDLCGCYTPQIEAMPQPDATAPFGQAAASSDLPSWTRGIYAAVAEQFTHFGTLQFEGEEVANPTDEYLDSSIMQVVAGYTINRWFAAQINAPLIYRSFERPAGFSIDRGTEAGLGDISLLVKAVAFHVEALARKETVSDGKNTAEITHDPDLTASAILLAGVKFPTGSAERLKEEFHEIDIPGAPESSVHGHDLTLGTGSYDAIIGGQASLRYKECFFQADAQYAARTEGAHQYRFANDFAWSAGPGVYFVRNRHTICGCQAVVSGEHKGLDEFRGAPAVDTGITSVFLGPRFLISLGKVSGELAAELPLSNDNTALQVVPDYRLRGSIAIRF
ncbi:MAG: hypothetical protein ACJ8KU_01695 [Chthoniobacterales bacterium]